MSWRLPIGECHGILPEGSVMASTNRGVSWRLARGECHGVSPEGSVMASRPRRVSWRLARGECHGVSPRGVSWRLARGECHGVSPEESVMTSMASMASVILMTLFSGDDPHNSGPIQLSRGDVGPKPSAAARPWTLAWCEWRAAAPGLKPLRLPRARNSLAGWQFFNGS